MKKLSAQQRYDSSIKHMPARIRYLCILTCILLVASSLIELWISLEGWFSDETFQAIYQGYSQFIPELSHYVIGGKMIYLATLFLDLMSFIPYYVALILAAVIFYRFTHAIFWDDLNIKLLKINSILILFDACYTPVKDTLQVLIFTSTGRHILTFSYGIGSEGVRSFIIALAIYTFSMILNSAKKISDENKLII